MKLSLFFIVISSLSSFRVAWNLRINQRIETNIECGIASSFKNLNVKVYSDEEIIASRHEFPWKAAIYKLKNGEWEYSCGGSLISTSHVVTAAHCIQNKNEISPTRVTHLRVKLGAHDISLIDQNEQGRITSDVKRYKMHNDWNPTDKRFGGDIAILELTMHIQFSEYIRPICLPEIDLTKIVNGSLVGWGYYDNSKIVSNVPRKVELNIIPDGDCFRDEERVVSISTKNMFCAGKKGVAVCPGDSGSGFYGSINGKYYLRGLVSSAAIADECSKGKLALYSDIVEYMDFITSFSFTGPEVRRSNRADLNCVDHGYAYCCVLQNFTVKSANTQINSIQTIHEASKFNNNVTFLHFWVENTDHLVNFRDGLVHQTFPNLIAYVIEGYERGNPNMKNNNINLRNNLVRSNFRGFHKIKKLGINHCDVERLPEDLFYDLTSLENVNLNDNNIRELPSKLLINNPRLKVFSAQNNVIEIIPSDFFKKNPKLWVVQLNDNNIAEIDVHFKMFNNLDFVGLIGNVCVNREFDVKKIGKDIFNELFINCRMQ